MPQQVGICELRTCPRITSAFCMGISSGNREVIIGQVQKNDASEIIRAVREEQTEYIVTYHGQPVAVIRSAVETQLVVVAGPRAELRAALVALTRLT